MLRCKTELFATPLVFNQTMRHCCAPFAEDAEFGAHPDAFSFIQVQGSCYCHPEPSDNQMLKTLRWALACASIQTEPLLVTLLLPIRLKSAFTSLLSHPSVLHLTTAQNIAFLDPTSWTGQADHTRTLRSGTDIILVGNQKGYDTYYTADTSSAQLEIALRNVGVPNHRIRPRFRLCRRQPQHPQDHMTPTMPRALTRIQEAKEAMLPILWRHGDHATNTSQAMPSQRPDAKSNWYTDGSKQVHDDGVDVIGAGVYNATRGISFSINPRESGATNTITRAELAAIASALLLMGQGQDEIIATDSQASICMIAKYMDSPQILQQCKHKVMLEDLLAQLFARARKGLQIRILKVKPHIGIQGNMEADKLATAATDSSKCSQEYAIDAIGHEDLQGLYWPVQTVEKMSYDGNVAAEKWQAGDLITALKKAVRPKRQAGNANITLYMDLWNQVKSKLLPNITEYLWTSPHTTQSNPAQCPESPLWSAVEHEHGLCPKDAIH